jgi:phosphate transport system permease protein
MSRKTKSNVFVAAMIVCLAISFGTLAWLLGTTLVDGIPALSKQLFTDPPSTLPEEAGARPAILATIYLAVLLLLMAVPIGVLTAIYLEEYARKERWHNRLLELNIQNLAAVPAIVYGILGLAFVVRGPFGMGGVLLAGAIIHTLVVVPRVIIASR